MNMSSDRAQGSVEYLVVLSASLTASIMIVVLATTLFTGYSTTTNTVQDKSLCAASGIELINYTQRYKDLASLRQDVRVNYQGSFKNCSGTSPLPAVTSSCEIKHETNKDACFVVYVSDSGWNGCFIDEKSDCRD